MASPLDYQKNSSLQTSKVKVPQETGFCNINFYAFDYRSNKKYKRVVREPRNSAPKVNGWSRLLGAHYQILQI